MSQEINPSALTDEDIDAILNSIDSGEYDDLDENLDSAGDENIDNEDPNANLDVEGNDIDVEPEGEGLSDNLDTDGDLDLDDDLDNDDNLDNDLDNDNKEDTDHIDGNADNLTDGKEDDGSLDDKGDEANPDGGENALVDDNIDGKDKDVPETKGDNDGKNPETAKIDESEYNKYKEFYEKVTGAEFMANGRKVKGLVDPDKIIQSQQMSHGFSDKMAGFKKYRPYMNPLKERGMLEDPEKFNLAMNLIDGDREAIKKHLKSLDIDPIVDLDIEKINYTGKNHVTSSSSINIDDALESARSHGVEDRIRKVIGEQWDEASFNEFANDANTRKDLIEHMADGTYDNVQDKISEIKRTDFDGSFSSLKSTDQYRRAIQVLRQETQSEGLVEAKAKEEADRLAKVEEEKNKILEERKLAEYKAQVEKKNNQVREERKKASSISRKKPKAKPAAKFDPMKLEGDELDNFVDSLIMA